MQQKLEAKFFGLFRVLHLIRKQEYKLELPKKWRIHDVFYVLLLEQDTTRKEWDNNMVELDNGDDSGKYEVEAIRDSTVFAKELELGHLPGLYYLVSWNGYLEEKNTWKPASAIQHLRKLISLFHKDYPDKPTATSPIINIAALMARLTIKPTGPLKRKQGWPAKGHIIKRVKWVNKEGIRVSLVF